MKHALLFSVSLLVLHLGLSACSDPVKRPPTQTGSIQVPSAEEAGGGRAADAPYGAMLNRLQQQHPVRDAQAAIARGERYFLCNAGRSATVPGLSAAVYATVRERCPTQCLEGVTDALVGPQHARYLTLALSYSNQWNQVMLTACR